MVGFAKCFLLAGFMAQGSLQGDTLLCCLSAQVVWFLFLFLCRGGVGRISPDYSVVVRPRIRDGQGCLP